MTDAAFHEAISANPADDTVRLAYADWLDEHAAAVPCPFIGPKAHHSRQCSQCSGSGVVYPDHDRAEFIKVQVEIARHPPLVAMTSRQWFEEVIRREEYFTVTVTRDWTPPPTEAWIDLEHREAGQTVRDLALAEPYAGHQVAILRKHPAGPYPCRELSARESALLSAHGRAWSGDVAKALGVGRYSIIRDIWGTPVAETDGRIWFGTTDRQWTFTRGFISAVRVPTLAEVCGDRECPGCGGNGKGVGWVMGLPHCPSCSGTGRVRACPACVGTGRERYDSGDPFGGYDYRCCRSCRGSGTLPPLGPALRDACPGLVEVWSADREPFVHSGGKASWYDGPRIEDQDDHPASNLPTPVYQQLAGASPKSLVTAYYPTRGAALSALAGAVGGWVRGLPAAPAPR